MAWFQKSANQGDPDAENYLGWMYLNGLGVMQDFSKAKEWFQKAADYPYPPAQFYLGVMYENGYGMSKDYEEARHGLFTYFLLKKLKETKGSVTMGELSDYIQEQVKRYSIVENGKSQTPTVMTSDNLRGSWKDYTFF